MSTEAAPAAPVTFGRYTLLERLAVGGMAEVFRAKISSSHGFQKILVIKRILPHLAADPGFVAMFIDEAKLTAQLTHPKIVQILDFGEVNGQYFTALEFIDGFDALGLLRIAAQKRTRIPTQLAVFIVDEILEALDYAHNARDMEGKSMQIVHRDISPSNIFISKRGDVKLGDFGIAHAKRRESKTQAGTLKGKYGYMSPEQVVGRPIDNRSDLFAVGVVLAELLTGRRLFSAPADLDVLLKVRDVHLDRLDKYGKDIPPALDRIVRRALKKDPAERPQSAAELHEELGNYLFAAGQRVGPNDLRPFSSMLLDADPETAANLLQSARRTDKAPPVADAVPAAAPKAAAAAASETTDQGGGDDGRGAVTAAMPPELVKTVTTNPAGPFGRPGAGDRRRRRTVAGARRRALVSAPVHAGVTSRRRWRFARANRDPAGQSDQERRRAVHLGGAQAPPGQRRGDQRHHADAIFLRPGAGQRDRPAALRAPRHREGDLPRGRRSRVGQLQRRRASGSVSIWWGAAFSAPLTWSSRSACCRTTTASWATRSWRSGCCVRSTCFACSPSRCAIG